MIKILKQLIQFKTIKSEPEELKKCCQYIERWIRQSVKGIKIKKYRKNNKPSMVVVIGTKDFLRPKYMLHGHIDVVEGRPKQFKPVMKGDRFYGRGSLDMKGGLAVMLELLRELSQKKPLPSFGLMITSDEEIGGFDGTGYLINKVGFRPKFFDTLEGAEKYEIGLKVKGILHARLISKGKDAHGAYPWKGENAIEKLLLAFQEIKKLFPETKSKNHWHSSVNLGMICGGEATNRVPDKAEAKIDIRFTPQEWQSCQKILKTVEKQTKGLARVKPIVYAEAVDLSEKNEYAEKLNQLIKKEMCLKRDVFCYKNGGSDARFAYYKEISAMEFGPVGKNSHSDNEWVSIKSLERIKQILKRLVRET